MWETFQTIYELTYAPLLFLVGFGIYVDNPKSRGNRIAGGILMLVALIFINATAQH